MKLKLSHLWLAPTVLAIVLLYQNCGQDMVAATRASSDISKSGNLSEDQFIPGDNGGNSSDDIAQGNSNDDSSGSAPSSPLVSPTETPTRTVATEPAPVPSAVVTPVVVAPVIPVKIVEPIKIPGMACSFNGQSINDGDTVTAYQNGTVLSGTCTSEARKCTDGILYGTYRFANCGVSAKKSCVFNGITYKHSQTFKGYRETVTGPPQVKSCESKTLTCNDGQVDIYDIKPTQLDFASVVPYKFASCNPNIAKKSCFVEGAQLAHGEVMRGVSPLPYGTGWKKLEFFCNDGFVSSEDTVLNRMAVWSTQMKILSGVPTSLDKKSCWFDDRTLAHGEKVKAYGVVSSTAMPAANINFIPCAGAVKELTCDNGEMGDTSVLMNGVHPGKVYSLSCYDFPLPVYNTGAQCELNGKKYNANELVMTFSKIRAPAGESCSDYSYTQKCASGEWRGNISAYSYSSCTSDIVNKDCTLDGVKVPNGGKISGYMHKVANYPDLCNEASLYCVDGKFNYNIDTTYKYASCSVGVAPKSCSFNGKVLPHGRQFDTFSQSSFPYGSAATACFTNKKASACIDGVLVEQTPAGLLKLASNYVYEACTVSFTPPPPPTPVAPVYSGGSSSGGKDYVPSSNSSGGSSSSSSGSSSSSSGSSGSGSSSGGSSNGSGSSGGSTNGSSNSSSSSSSGGTSSSPNFDTGCTGCFR